MSGSGDNSRQIPNASDRSYCALDPSSREARACNRANLIRRVGSVCAVGLALFAAVVIAASGSAHGEASILAQSIGMHLFLQTYPDHSVLLMHLYCIRIAARRARWEGLRGLGEQRGLSLSLNLTSSSLIRRTQRQAAVCDPIRSSPALGPFLDTQRDVKPGLLCRLPAAFFIEVQ